jgi:hypothetical protein
MIHNGRLASLLARKAQLEAEVQRELRVPMPDQLRLATLKKRKLVVKDEIQKMAHA